MTKKEALYPLKFKPVFKDYIWGGRNLEKLGRKIPAEGVTAESWEIAGHPDGTTLVANGALAGKPLTALVDEYGVDLVGHQNAWALERGKFPLLIKLLDANRPLSVQVHPSDAYALAHEGNELGKAEMWVILEAAPNAEVIIGVKKGTTPENFRQAIQDGVLEKYLHRIRVKTGDYIDVPAGTLHAIMDGVLIAEIQQNSNTTYRVYDWNRLGADEKPRPLHVDKAMDVIDFEQVEPTLRAPQLVADENGVRRSVLVSNPYFTTERVEISAGSSYCGKCSGATLEIWGLLAGAASVNETPLKAVEFVLLPASLGEFGIHAKADAIFLRTYVA